MIAHLFILIIRKNSVNMPNYFLGCVKIDSIQHTLSKKKKFQFSFIVLIILFLQINEKVLAVLIFSHFYSHNI